MSDTDQAGPGRHVHRRHRHHVRRQERRRGHRQGQRRRARSTSRPARRGTQLKTDRHGTITARHVRTTVQSRWRRDANGSTCRGARARAPRHHQALRRAVGQRRRRPPAAARRDPRPAGRERRGQVDVDERPLRDAPARRGRDPASTASRSTIELAARRHRAGHRHGAPALHADPGHDRGRERRARRRAQQGRPARRRAPPSSACASCRSATGSTSTPTRVCRGHLGRPAAARRDPARAGPRRPDPRPRRADGGAHRRRRPPSSPSPARRCATRARRSSSSPTSCIEVLEVADRVTVLRRGKTIGTIDTAGADEALARHA